MSEQEGRSSGRSPDCCAATGIADHFDGWARDRVATGADVLAPVSERLCAALVAADPRGADVLEIGCGTGGLLLRLLEAGAERVTGIDLSETGTSIARRKLADAGFAGRSEFEVGDGATTPLRTHDWVLLDRVMCCYPDADRLLERSLTAASRLVAFSIPASTGPRGLAARVRFGVEDLWDRWHHRGTRMYVHDVRRLERAIRAAGFRPMHRETRRLWWLGVYRR